MRRTTSRVVLAAAFAVAVATPVWAGARISPVGAEAVATAPAGGASSGGGAHDDGEGTHGDSDASQAGAGTAPGDWRQMDARMAARDKSFPARTEGVGAAVLAPKVLADGTKEFHLTAKVVPWEVEPGKTVQAWSYNGIVPGPTLKLDVGDRARIVLRNELPESTVIHWHGVRLPNAMDGVPHMTQDPVPPGGTFTYAFTAERAAVSWYHSHHDGTRQVSNGLYGAILIGKMPLPRGVRVDQELTFQVQDSGAIGLSVNGKSFPATEPVRARRGEWVQVHYINAGLQLHPMHLHGLDQLVIAKDGYPVPAPYKVDTLVVAPGERYTVLVNADRAGTWAWHCHIFSHSEGEQGMFGMVTAMVVT